MKHSHPIQASPRTGRGFSLIELLVVILIIILLLSIVLVVTTKAIRTAEISSTRFLMRSVSDGLEQFKNDFGYYPPLLRDDFEMLNPDRTVLSVQANAAEELRDYRFFSLTSLPVYLVGVGRLEPTEMTSTGLDPDRHDGLAGPGIRDPGPDRSWGGALDRRENKPAKTGRTYGPYVDFGDSDSLRAVLLTDLGPKADGTNPRFADVSLESDIDQSLPVIVDAWGQPIRYYRSGWRTTSPVDGQFTLDFAPIELLNQQTIANEFSAAFDQVASSAPYFLLSAGPNRQFAGRRSRAGGSGSDLQFDPLNLNETNTQIMDEVDDLPGEIDKMIEAISDNIRVTP